MIINIMGSQKQREFAQAVLDQSNGVAAVGYGGAMGGGKTHISCVVMLIRRLMYSQTMGLMLRRVALASDLNLGEKIRQLILEWGLPYGRLQRGEIQFFATEKLFRFPNGSILQLGYCDSINDWERYWGNEYADICFEEATQFPEITYTNLSSRNRSSNPKCVPKRWATANPGGQFDEWYYRRFVDAQTRDRDTIWIPSTLDDSPALLERDPGYAPRIRETQPEWRYKQWRKGLWNVVAGSYFLVPRSAIVDVKPPYWAEWYGGVDWGYSDPFVCLLAAVWREANGRRRCHIYSEIYKQKLEYPEQARLALEQEAELRDIGVIMTPRPVVYYADPATIKDGRGKTTTKTTRDIWRENGFVTFPASTNARVPGWRLLQSLLVNPSQDDPELTISPSCRMLLYELEKAVIEGSPGIAKSEDIQQGHGYPDHALDALRYLLVSVYPLSYKPEPKRDAYAAVPVQMSNV